MDGRLQVFAGTSHPTLAAAIMEEMEAPLGRAIVGTYRNGETRVKLDENVRGSDAFVIQSICDPYDHHLMELLLIIDALRRASAARITAVVPYYGYSKQEKKTASREPISAKLVAKLITTAGAHRVLAIDLHAPAIEGFSTSRWTTCGRRRCWQDIAAGWGSTGRSSSVQTPVE